METLLKLKLLTQLRACSTTQKSIIEIDIEIEIEVDKDSSARSAERFQNQGVIQSLKSTSSNTLR
jgi:hypothetical protein